MNEQELLRDAQQKLAIKTDEWRLAVIQLEQFQNKWKKERKEMCRAVTRANKARNDMGRWTVAIQNENDLLRLMLKERGLNADFLLRAKKATEKITRIEDIFHAEFEWGNADEVYRALRTVFEEVADAE